MTAQATPTTDKSNTVTLILRPAVQFGDQLSLPLNRTTMKTFEHLRELAGDDLVAFFEGHEDETDYSGELDSDSSYALVVDSKATAQQVATYVTETLQLVPGAFAETAPLRLYYPGEPKAEELPRHQHSTLNAIWGLLHERNLDYLRTTVDGTVTTMCGIVNTGANVEIVTWAKPTFTFTHAVAVQRATFYLPTSAPTAKILTSQPGSYLVDEDGDKVEPENVWQNYVFLLLSDESHVVNLAHLAAVANMADGDEDRTEFKISVAVMRPSVTETRLLEDYTTYNDLWMEIDGKSIFTTENGVPVEYCRDIRVGATVNIISFDPDDFDY